MNLTNGMKNQQYKDMGNHNICSAIGSTFSYKDNLYKVTGIRKNKCRISREWYDVYEYTDVKTGINYSRCCKEFLERFERSVKMLEQRR